MPILINPVIKMLLVSLGAVLTMSLCSCSDPSPLVQSKAIPLSEIKGDKIMFEMCGKKISLPRKFISRFESNGHEGLAREPIKRISMWINLGGYTDLPRSELTESTTAEIVCDTRTPWRKYSMNGVKFTAYKDLPELGLRRFEVAPPVLRFDYYYQPLNDVEKADGFFLACQNRNINDVPMQCWISGSPHNGISFLITPSVGSTLRNWRIYKESFEDFIQIEEKQ